MTKPRTEYHRAKRATKRRYNDMKARELMTNAMRDNPRKTWRKIHTFEKGSRAHHNQPKIMALRDPETNEVGVTPESNIAAIQKYGTHLYSKTDQEIDWTILEEIKTYPELPWLAKSPGMEELKRAVRK